MKRLELKQGLSYAVRGFSCVRGVPFDVEDNMAEKLLATGRFEALPSSDSDGNKEGDIVDSFVDSFMALFGNKSGDEPADTDNEPDSLEFVQDNAEQTVQIPVVQDNAELEHTVSEQFTAQQLSADYIARLRKPELEALAAEKNIDISDCSNNDERAAKICGALGLASLVQMGFED